MSEISQTLRVTVELGNSGGGIYVCRAIAWEMVWYGQIVAYSLKESHQMWLMDQEVIISRVNCFYIGLITPIILYKHMSYTQWPICTYSISLSMCVGKNFQGWEGSCFAFEMRGRVAVVIVGSAQGLKIFIGALIWNVVGVEGGGGSDRRKGAGNAGGRGSRWG